MILELRNICKNYDQGKLEVPALRNVSLTVDEGEYVAIMGPSGSGKTTLMNIIGCLDVPTSGEYFLEGQDLSGQSDLKLSQVRLRSIGFVFQSFFLLPRQSAVENVALPLLYAGVRRKERLEIAKRALERVGLGDRLDFKPPQLSGGQCQRVAIARAIVNDPKILLADEPTGALDTASGQQIMEIFQKLNDEGVTIVMITHESEIASHAQRVLHIRDGRLIDAGAALHLAQEARPLEKPVQPIPVETVLSGPEVQEEEDVIEIESIPVFEEEEETAPVLEAAAAENDEAAEPPAEETDTSKAAPIEIESIFVDEGPAPAEEESAGAEAKEKLPPEAQPKEAPASRRVKKPMIVLQLEDEPAEETRQPEAADESTAEPVEETVSQPEDAPFDIESIFVEDAAPEPFIDEELSALLDKAEKPNYYFGDTLLRESGIEPDPDPDTPALVDKPTVAGGPDQISFDIWQGPEESTEETEPSAQAGQAETEVKTEELPSEEEKIETDLQEEADDDDGTAFDTAFDAVESYEPAPIRGGFGAPKMTDVDLAAAFAPPPPPWGQALSRGKYANAHPRLVDIESLDPRDNAASARKEEKQ